MDERIRRLAALDSGDVPFLSIYLDVRPEATGERPGVRSGLVVLRDRMRDIRKTFGPRGEALESFAADAARIDDFVENRMEVSTEGLAIFACNALGVFETVEAGTPFENQVSAGARADLYQYARLDDEYETAVVALVDTNTARLFVYRYGALVSRDGPDDDPESYRRRQAGGWSQARYQRHIDEHYKDFAAETVRAIGDLCAKEHAAHIVLAGSETAITALQAEMPRDLAEHVRDVVRIDMRADRNEIAAEIAPVLAEAEHAFGESVVERLVGEVRRGGLGTSGLFGTLKALERGQVDTVVLTGDGIEEDERAELVRAAAATGAEIEVVEASDDLERLGGVGALLRYRI